MLSRYVNSIVSGVLQYQVFASVGLFGLSADEFRDAVIDVDDVNAGLQLFKLRPSPDCAPMGSPTLATNAEYLGVGENSDSFAVCEFQYEAGCGIAFGNYYRGAFSLGA